MRTTRQTRYSKRGRNKSEARRSSTFQCRVLIFPAESASCFSGAATRHWNVELRFCTRHTNMRKVAAGLFGGFYSARGVFVGLGGGSKEEGCLGAVRRDAFSVACRVCGERCVVQGGGTDSFFGQCGYSHLPNELASFCRSVAVGARFGGFVLCNTGLRHCIVFWHQCMTGARMCSFCRGQEISCNGWKRRYRGMERRCTV